ncbi:unnamed protein product [Parnassius mnemosyne]|uniref:Uncharacterized protein n=2 Tax=Parnassius mnemosyne TaxID=213953 RepID=A0AAV1MBI0_9NEOP
MTAHLDDPPNLGVLFLCKNNVQMIVVVFALVAVACAVPVDDINKVEPEARLLLVKEPEKIISSEFNHDSEGGYNFSFETEKGINRNENGEVKEVLDEDQKPHMVVVVRGSYSYTDDDGKVETINYSADEKGFHADGDSIPTNAPSRR